MSAWWTRVGKAVVAGTGAAASSVREARGDAGDYQSLYTYLRGRYADRVVLTFAQIEDLIGFSLPAPARLQKEWWGGTDEVAHRSAQSDSWTLANRTATVNLWAQNVVFERHA
jgi:hypothetical protein